MTAILVLFVVQCLYINATQQARAWVTKRHDEAIAGALDRDIMAMVDAPEGADVTIDFFGIREAINVYPQRADGAHRQVLRRVDAELCRAGWSCS